MSPIEFGAAPFTLPIPDLDINLIGSIALTVWQVANTYSILIVFFFMLLGVGIIGWLYSLVTHRKSAGYPTYDLGEAFDEYAEEWAYERTGSRPIARAFSEVRGEQFRGIFDD